MYSVDAAERLAQEMGGGQPHYPFIRLPWVALLHRPLALLPLTQAITIWRAVCLTGVAVFLLLWPTPKDRALIAACWSIPLVAAFVTGQDVPLLLGIFAGSCALLSHQRSIAAGLLFSLFTAKFHLLLLLPLLLIRKRLWRFGVGFTCGSAGLLLLSCAVAGTEWIDGYFRAISRPEANPGVAKMWNIRGVFPDSIGFEVLAALLVAGIIWLYMSKVDLRAAMSAMLAGGVLISHHSYTYDASLILPMLLLALERAKATSVATVLAVFLLTPAPHLLWLLGWPANAVFVAALVGLIAWEVVHRRGDSLAFATPTR